MGLESEQVVIDPDVTTEYGYYECPECGIKVYDGGKFPHKKRVLYPIPVMTTAFIMWEIKNKNSQRKEKNCFN